MSIFFKIKSALGNSGAFVTKASSLLVSNTPYTDLENEGALSRYRLLSDLMGVGGLGKGAVSANVDGSSTQQIFKVEASSVFDIRIMKIFIYLEDTTVSHSTFGALSALTNGIDLVLIEGGEETFLIKSAKKFVDLIEQTFCEKPFGSGASAFELTSTTGTQDSWILPFYVDALVPNGVRIGRRTNDRLELRINDDLTGLTQFRVRVGGYRHYPHIEKKL